MDENRDDQKKQQPASAMWGAGIALGIGVGVAMGVALKNIGAGVAIGAGLGVAFALAFTATKKPSSGGGTPQTADGPTDNGDSGPATTSDAAANDALPSSHDGGATAADDRTDPRDPDGDRS